MGLFRQDRADLCIGSDSWHVCYEPLPPTQEHQAWGVDPLQQEHVTTPGSPGSGSSEEDNNNLIDEPAVKEEALRWQSGQVAVIEEGGRDVQSVLDCEGVKLGIIDWHARWIEACLEIQPYMQRSVSHIATTDTHCVHR